MKTKITDLEKRILFVIGHHYLAENENDYDITNESIELINITDIEYNETTKELSIRTGRPGILVGRDGEDINSLLKTLKKEIDTDLKIKIVECYINNYLYPVDTDTIESDWGMSHY